MLYPYVLQQIQTFARSMKPRKVNSPICRYTNIQELTPMILYDVLDCCVTVLILTAQTLSALKKWDCWIAWLLVNIANLTLYLKAGLVFMPIVSCLYLVNGIWSLFTWYRLYRKDA